MSRSPSLALAFFSLILLVTGWSVATAENAGAISVGDPYANAVPPGQLSTAAFMTLTNHSAHARALVAAESPAAEAVELHAHLHEDGMMRMRRLERVDLPPDETVAFEPGGLHLMLIGLREPPVPGTDLALTLVLDDGTRISVKAPIRKIEPR